MGHDLVKSEGDLVEDGVFRVNMLHTIRSHSSWQYSLQYQIDIKLTAVSCFIKTIDKRFRKA